VLPWIVSSAGPLTRKQEVRRPPNGVEHPIRAARIFSTGTITPDTHAPVRDASILFDVAVNPMDGALYAVWQDTRFDGIEEVAFAMSTDGGMTWTTPIKVDKTPPNSNRLRQQAFIPSVAVNSGGMLVVTYYDFRNDNSSGELTDHWAVFCDPGASDCADPANWGDEVRLTNTSFDILDAPVARGHFLGDYTIWALYGAGGGSGRHAAGFQDRRRCQPDEHLYAAHQSSHTSQRGARAVGIDAGAF
jgi:hypothetical protein